MGTSTRIDREQAPCGRTVNGRRYLDEDQDGYVFDHVTYDCGCQRLRRQYHDGGVQLRVVDHHGKVRVDEHSSTHEA
jgi:hypothetical protein